MIAILVAGTIAFVVGLAGTPLAVAYFRDRGFGQPIRDEGPLSHRSKAGTPTMGGAVIVLGVLTAFVVVHLGTTRLTSTGLLVFGTFVAMALVGFADDFIKLRMRRNMGLNKATKILGQALIAGLFASVGPTVGGIQRNISLVGEIAIDVPGWLFFVWIFVLLTGFSNAVNLTDGLDGLAAGSAALVLGAYTLIAFWQFRNADAYPLGASEALDLAIIAAAAMTVCAGFLWHNAPPARIFMGDTGSLALGGLIAAIAVATNTQLLLVLFGGLFVLETASVILQVVVFRTSGRRIFRMAPLHHHFELGGWQEITIIVRFWIIAGIGVALGLGVFYAEWFSRIGPLQ